MKSNSKPKTGHARQSASVSRKRSIHTTKHTKNNHNHISLTRRANSNTIKRQMSTESTPPSDNSSRSSGFYAIRPSLELSPEEIARRREQATSSKSFTQKRTDEFIQHVRDSLDDDKLAQKHQNDPTAYTFLPSGMPYDPYSDPKNPAYIPKPRVDDAANPYSLATQIDNTEYVRQIGVARNFENALTTLKETQLSLAFVNNKPKDIIPSTRGELNAMLQNALIEEKNYELAWDRFSIMIQHIPDENKSRLEHSLHEQFNTPILFRRDYQVDAQRTKVLFGPDMTSYQLMIMGILQAFEDIKTKYEPELVHLATEIFSQMNITNSEHGDNCDNQAKMMWVELSNARREIQRRQALDVSVQEELLQNDTIAAPDRVLTDQSGIQTGLEGALTSLIDNSEIGFKNSNRLVYTDQGISEHQQQQQRRSKLAALGQTIVDIVDDPTTSTSDKIRHYHAQRVIASEDDDDNDDKDTDVNSQPMPPLSGSSHRVVDLEHEHENTANHGDSHHKQHTDTDAMTKHAKMLFFGPDVAYQPLITATKRQDGTFRYKINLSTLPFSINYGSELDQWIERLDVMGHGTENRSLFLLEKKQELLEDPFSNEYNCLKDIATWSSRFQFIAAGICEHFYAMLYKQNPAVYQLVRHTTKIPQENMFGLNPNNTDLGHDISTLELLKQAAQDQNLHYTWLEVSSLLSNFTPAPQHVPTLSQRAMMIKTSFLQQQFFFEMISKMPTFNDTIDAENDDEQLEQDTNENENASPQTQQHRKETIPPLSQQHFYKCIQLFIDLGKHEVEYKELVSVAEKAFLSKINSKLLNEYFLQSTPDKLFRNSVDSPEALLELHEENHTKKLTIPRPTLLTIDTLSPEQKAELETTLPKKKIDMKMLERVVAQTIHKYPLLASLAPQSCSMYEPLQSILKRKFPPKITHDPTTNQPVTTQRISSRFLTLKSLPITPKDINIAELGFDTDEKINRLALPPQITSEIAALDVSMVKVPIIHTVTQSPENMELKNIHSNIHSLILAPQAAFVSMNDAIDWVNHFTQLGKFVKTHSEQMGEVDEATEFEHLLAQQQYLQAHRGANVPLHELHDTSCNYRHLSRLGMFYIDSMILSFAQQNEAQIPAEFTRLFKQQYDNLTNAVVNQYMPQKSTSNNNNVIETEQTAFDDDINAVSPVKNRLQQWHERQQNIFLRPNVFFSKTIQERVDFIDQHHERQRQTNIFARFFDLENSPDRYQLLRSYLRFAIRAGDQLSLEKALFLYRSSTHLLEWVQRRSNDDVYMETTQAANKAFTKARSEEEFMSINAEIEKKRADKRQFSDNLPAATRLDMTNDDFERSTTNQPDSGLWSKWHRTNDTKSSEILKQSGVSDIVLSHMNPDSSTTSSSTSPLSGDEFDVMIAKTGILDEYSQRIDALLHPTNANPIHRDDADEVTAYQDGLKQRKNKSMGNLFVPGYDVSDGEDEIENDGTQFAQNATEGGIVNQDGSAINTGTKNNHSKMATSLDQQGRLQTSSDPTADSSTTATAHSPQQRLKNLSKASHIQFDYPLTQMIINFHQLLIRNQCTFTKVGLSPDVVSQRFSDEISAQWALRRRTLYDQRIEMINQFEQPHAMLEPNDPRRHEKETSSEQRERIRQRTKFAIRLLKKNRPEKELLPFERLAAQIAIMSIDTMIMEGYLAVAKIVAKQAYDDGLLTKEFIDEHFLHHGPDLDADEATIMKNEMKNAMKQEFQQS